MSGLYFKKMELCLRMGLKIFKRLTAPTFILFFVNSLSLYAQDITVPSVPPVICGGVTGRPCDTVVSGLNHQIENRVVRGQARPSCIISRSEAPLHPDDRGPAGSGTSAAPRSSGARRQAAAPTSLAFPTLSTFRPCSAQIDNLVAGLRSGNATPEDLSRATECPNRGPGFTRMAPSVFSENTCVNNINQGGVGPMALSTVSSPQTMNVRRAANADYLSVYFESNTALTIQNIPTPAQGTILFRKIAGAPSCDVEAIVFDGVQLNGETCSRLYNVREVCTEGQGTPCLTLPPTANISAANGNYTVRIPMVISSPNLGPQSARNFIVRSFPSISALQEFLGNPGRVNGSANFPLELPTEQIRPTMVTGSNGIGTPTRVNFQTYAQGYLSLANTLCTEMLRGASERHSREVPANPYDENISPAVEPRVPNSPARAAK